MKELGIDPKKYKYLKSDDKSTTLQHKNGHTLTIVHSVLSPKNQAILKALSNVPKEDETPSQENEATNQKLASGGKIVKNTSVGTMSSDNMFAEGGIFDSNDSGNEVDDIPRWDNYTGPKIITDPKSAPLFNSNANDSTTPEEDKQRHQEEDKQDQNFRNWNPAPKDQEEDFSGYQNFQRQGMATGGEVEDPAPDQVMTPNPNYVSPLPQAPAEKPQPIDPAQSKIQQLYNQQVANNPGMSIEDQLAARIGPKGEPPKQINLEAIKNAQEILRKQAVDKTYASQDAEMQAQQKNQALQALGFAPTESSSALPDTVGANEQPNDGLGQPATPNNDALSAGMQAQQGMLQQGYQNQLAGINQEAAAKGELGNQQAAIYQNNILAQQKAQQAYQQSFNQLNNERKSFIEDIQNNHINPDQYWDNHSKLAAGIGMILAGFNPTNRPNAAIEYIQHQMDNNLQAQIQNMGAKKTLLEANLQQFGNLRDSMDMTRLMQADIVQNTLMQAAAKAQSPLAKATALEKAGQLQQQFAPLQQQFAMRQAMMNMANNGADPNSINHLLSYMRIAAPEQAKEMEGRYVPGVGLANVQIPDKVRQDIIAQKDVQQIMAQTLDFARKNAGSLNPKVRAQGQALINELQSKIRTAEDQGVYKESEANFMRKTIGDNPANFLTNWTTVPKIKELQQIKMNDYNNTLKTYGLPQQQMPQQPQYKTVNGVKYMRGPNGQAIRVK